MDNETPALDRLYDLTIELLKSGQEPQQLILTVRDATDDWRRRDLNLGIKSPSLRKQDLENRPKSRALFPPPSS